MEDTTSQPSFRVIEPDMNEHHSGLNDRDAILETLKGGMDDLQRSTEVAEPATIEEQQLQLRRYHELGYLANQYRKLQCDTDLDEMDQRMALLEDDSETEAH